jgi:zinc transport system ATP-binding protein
MEGDLYELLQTLNQRLTIVMVSHDIGFVSEVVKSVI